MIAQEEHVSENGHQNKSVFESRAEMFIRDGPVELAGFRFQNFPGEFSIVKSEKEGSGVSEKFHIFLLSAVDGAICAGEDAVGRHSEIAVESVCKSFERSRVSFLRAGDLLVINNTKVIPARIFAHIDGRETVFEILLLRRKDYTRWECIMRPARKAKKGSVLKVSDELTAEVEEVGDYGVRTVKFAFDGVFEDILDRVGNMPLPPYIHEKLADKTRYNTVYSKTDGSAAAPTAGLHFTPELMDRVREKGAEFVEVLLHIGLGTFRPVKAENVAEHEMHSEYF